MKHDNSAERREGYLFLADISGFDAYLAEVELEHADGIMTELLELIVASLRPPLRIASIQPDAVLAFESAAALTRGETLLELAETSYVAFRDRLKSIARNNTCGCRACAAVATLDLKFLIHFGEFIAQPGPDGRATLVGLAANVVSERLLKDQMAKEARSYVLFTEPSLAMMGIRPAGMAEHQGRYPDVGEVRSASLDLSQRYDALRGDSRAFVTNDEADMVVAHDFSYAPAQVWDWLNDPYKRTRWLRWTTWKPGLRPAGRTDIGAINHCAHGIGHVVETILDWRPYDYFTVEMAQDSLWSSLVVTYQLEALPEGGTRLRFQGRLERAPTMWLARPMMRAILPRKLKQDFVRMAQLMSQEAAPPDDQVVAPEPVAAPREA